MPENDIRISGKKNLAYISVLFHELFRWRLALTLHYINSIHGEAHVCDPVYDCTRKFVLIFVLRNDRKI